MHITKTQIRKAGAAGRADIEAKALEAHRDGTLSDASYIALPWLMPDEIINNFPAERAWLARFGI